MNRPNPTPPQPDPPSKAIAISSGDGGQARNPRRNDRARNRRREQGRNSPRRFGRAATRKRNARRRAKLQCTVAGGDARVVSQQVDSITKACARDYNGVAIKRQLNGFGVVFALMVEAIALGLRVDGRFERTWAHPLSRRLATSMIFLGYECQEQKFKGRTVWCVAGYSVPCIGLQATVRFCANAIYDAEGKPKGVSVTTMSGDIGRLRDGGFLLAEEKPHAHQFDSQKLIAQGKGWAVGPQQKNPDGSLKWQRNKDGSYKLDANGNRIPVQWAFNHYYIPFCPFAEGTRGRVKPGKFDHPFRSKQSTGEHPTPALATTEGGRLADAKQYARDVAAADLAAQLAERDAKRTQPDATAAEVERIQTPRDRPRDRPRPSQPEPPTLTYDAAWLARMIAQSDADPPGSTDS